jgi:hypothetical protein
MKRFKKGLLFSLILALVVINLPVPVWAQHDPIEDEWNMMDLILVRPASAVAGVVGAGLFVLTLPFTAPTKGVDKSAEMFIVRPFQFAFEREFPDEDNLFSVESNR